MSEWNWTHVEIGDSYSIEDTGTQRTITSYTPPPDELGIDLEIRQNRLGEFEAVDWNRYDGPECGWIGFGDTPDDAVAELVEIVRAGTQAVLESTEELCGTEAFDDE